MAKKARDSSEAGDHAPLDSAIRLDRLTRLIRQASHAGGLVPAQWEALRFVSRASRHSRTPGATARYLGATKGTVSQSLSTLEKKGLIRRLVRPEGQRHTLLALTEAGLDILAQDPLAALAQDIAALDGKVQRRLARGLSELLERQIKRQGSAVFGTCGGCRYFREGAAGGLAVCMKDGGSLSAAETELLCIERVER